MMYIMSKCRCQNYVDGGVYDGRCTVPLLKVHAVPKRGGGARESNNHDREADVAQVVGAGVSAGGETGGNAVELTSEEVMSALGWGVVETKFENDALDTLEDLEERRMLQSPSDIP
jgi:hypothetical protein